MKKFSGFSRQLFVCLLLSFSVAGFLNAQSSARPERYTLQPSRPNDKTDVVATLERVSDSEKYILRVFNPSGKRLRIHFYADGRRYTYAAGGRRCWKPFEFKGADDGMYMFGVQDGKVELKKQLEIKTVYATRRQLTILPSKTTREVVLQ